MGHVIAQYVTVQVLRHRQLPRFLQIERLEENVHSYAKLPAGFYHAEDTSGLLQVRNKRRSC